MRQGPKRSRLVEQTHQQPPRSERYGNCSVLPIIDPGWGSLPSWRVRLPQEHKCVGWSRNHKSDHVFTNNVSRIGSIACTTYQAFSGIKGNHSQTNVRRRYKETTTMKTPINDFTSWEVLITYLPTSGMMECNGLEAIFSYESSFSLNADDWCIRVWWKPGHLSDSAFVVERHTMIIQDLTPKEEICWYTPVVVLPCTLTARSFVDEI
ncbi:hypothetical protein TNCV_1827581 [Trichonephila clavipes]|nr:hypothetical protein TNCV_1827581 [Trichonephila clavipes]